MRKTKNIISNVFAIILIIVTIIVYRKYDFNFYFKGIAQTGKTSFSRDSNIHTSTQKRSYKVENKEYNDAMFYKRISVKKYTPYKVTCMVKTKEVQQYENKQTAGAQIILKGTEEHSKVLYGNNDWTKLEFAFNSKNNETIEIGFRLGGNMIEAKGTAWFADLSLEEGFTSDDTTWNFECVIFDNIDVTLSDGTKIKSSLSTSEVNDLKNIIQSFPLTCDSLSKNKMHAKYNITETKQPITSISYDDQNGYYISESDIYNFVEKNIGNREYDHLFACFKLPSEESMTKNSSVTDWIGLGNMEYCGKGFSDIRVPDDNKSKGLYSYSNKNTFPEEVLLHEFLHTLERNSSEYGYDVPALHDYAKYGYKDSDTEGLKVWYKDYMNKEIKYNDSYIGVDENMYKYKPIQFSNFDYYVQLDYLNEPKDIVQSIKSITTKIENLFKKTEEQKIVTIVSD